MRTELVLFITGLPSDSLGKRLVPPPQCYISALGSDQRCSHLTCMPRTRDSDFPHFHLGTVRQLIIVEATNKLDCSSPVPMLVVEKGLRPNLLGSGCPAVMWSELSTRLLGEQ
jgi:hypothetical protein